MDNIEVGIGPAKVVEDIPAHVGVQPTLVNILLVVKAFDSHRYGPWMLLVRCRSRALFFVEGHLSYFGNQPGGTICETWWLEGVMERERIIRNLIRFTKAGS